MRTNSPCRAGLAVETIEPSGRTAIARRTPSAPGVSKMPGAAGRTVTFGTETLFPLIETLTAALLGVASHGTSNVINCWPVLAVLMLSRGAALVPDGAEEGNTMLLLLVCWSGVAYMLGVAGKAAGERGDPTTRVPTPQGDRAV